MNEEDKTATKTVTSILDLVAVRNLKYDTVCQWANKLSEFRQTPFPQQLYRVSYKRKVQKKEEEKKLTSVSFMYVCVAGNGEMLFFFLLFFPNNSLIDNSLSE